MAHNNTCEYSECNNSLEGKRSSAKYCCDSHRALASQEKKAMNRLNGLPSNAHTQNGYSPGNSGETFLLQQRIIELQKEKQDLRDELKEERRQKEQIKEQLQQKLIEMVKLEKDEVEGLGKLDVDKIGQLAPHIPALVESLKGLFPNAGGNQMRGLPQGMPLKTQQRVQEFAEYMANIDEEQQDAIWQILSMASAGQPEKAKQLIDQYNNTYGTNEAVNS